MYLVQNSFKVAAVAPMLFSAFMTAATSVSFAANDLPMVDQTCSRTYNPIRGAMPGDCYSRQEAQKFVCLNANPEKGQVSQACGKVDGLLPVYFGKRAGTPYMNILTSTPDASGGVVLESGQGEYRVGYVYKDIQFGNLGDSIPSWADPSNAAPKRDDRVAAALCGEESGCRVYGTTYKKVHEVGDRYAMGAKGVALSQDGRSLDVGKYFLFRIAQDGGAAIDLVGPRGDSHMEFAMTPVGAVMDNIARIQAVKPATAASQK